MTPPAAPCGPFAAGAAPRGVGIDAEQVARFEKFAAGQKPWRHVYSPREAAHLAGQPLAARAFCFAFCCKEALCKALGEAYAFPECQCLYRDGEAEQQVLLAPGLRERHALAQVLVLFDGRYVEERGECLVEVRISRGASPSAAPAVRTLCDRAASDRGGARLETLAVAAVAAGRARIEQEHFSAAELAELARRPVQSVAGFFALKRALAAVWADAGAPAAPRPRGFELGHHPSGAPRIVAAPEGFAAADTLVSIAHTRAWAYALAAPGGRDDLLYFGGASVRERA